MRKVFDAIDMLEAHVVKGVLQQEGIVGFIQGEYLHGGIGDLPVSGLVRIEVNDPDFDTARSVITEWEKEQVSDDQHLPKSWAPVWMLPFITGVSVGILLTLWLAK
jgi:hypothetical protein